MSNTQLFKRVRFCASPEGDEDMLAERTGILIHGGERNYTQAGFDSLVMLDEDADADTYAREYFATFAECWFPNSERWPEAKWGHRLLVEADSAAHLETIGFAEIDVAAGTELRCEGARRTDGSERIYKAVIKFKGESYYRTGKRGTNVGTGLPVAEYSTATDTGPRIWATADAKHVFPE